MKIINFFLLALIISYQTSNAQSNFAPIGATWHHDGDFGIYKTTVSKDTLYKGKTCSKVEQDIFVKRGSSHPHLETTRDLYIYSNSDTVFCYNNRVDEFTPLFIFNANVGDTVKLPYFSPASNCTAIFERDSPKFEFIVDSVKYINYDGKLLKTVFSKILRSKKLHDESNFGWVDYYDSLNVYVEKLGSLKTGFLPNCIGMCPTIAILGCASPSKLRCYEEDSIKIHLLGTCVDSTWVSSSISPKSILSQKLAIVPNPTTDKISLGLETLPFDSKIIIYDVMGKKVIEKTFRKEVIISIEISNLNTGIYLLKLYNEEGAFLSHNTFIKQ